MRAVAVATDSGLRIVARADRFYLWMAVTCLAVAVIGFAPTYWVPLATGRLDVPPIVHVHALFFYGWMLFFIKQTHLVASGAVVRHRELGIAGVALATGMCFVGTAVAVGSLRHGQAAGFGEAATAFSSVPFTGIAVFGGLVAAAIMNVKKPQIHKRLMLVATASMLQAAVGRWFLLFLAPPRAPGDIGPVSPPPVVVTVLPGLVVDLLIVAAMVHDRRTRGRVHPTYWIAGAAVLAVQVLRVPVSETAAWTSIAQGITALLP